MENWKIALSDRYSVASLLNNTVTILQSINYKTKYRKLIGFFQIILGLFLPFELSFSDNYNKQ